MQDIVIVTEKEYGKAAGMFRDRPDCRFVPSPSREDALSDAVRFHKARCAVLGVDRYTGPLYEALAEARSDDPGPCALIARFGVGHDGIDKKLTEKYGIVVTNTPGVLSRSVAEHTFWLIGAVARNVVRGDAAMRRNEFASWCGFELHEKTILVVGLGEIGRHVAKIAHRGFGMRVLASDRFLPEEMAARIDMSPDEFFREYGIARFSVDVDSLLPEADVVSLHLASTPETFHFMSRDRFERMKASAVMVNTARGPIVDEFALFDMLKRKRIAGAALDVFEKEPYLPVEAGSDLRMLENIVLTPHLGSNTHETNRRMAGSVLRNIELFRQGRFQDMEKVDRVKTE